MTKIEFKITEMVSDGLSESEEVSVQSGSNVLPAYESDLDYIIRKFKQCLLGAGYHPEKVSSIDYEQDDEEYPEEDDAEVGEFILDGTTYYIPIPVLEYIIAATESAQQFEKLYTNLIGPTPSDLPN